MVAGVPAGVVIAEALAPLILSGIEYLALLAKIQKQGAATREQLDQLIALNETKHALLHDLQIPIVESPPSTGSGA